MGKVGLPEPSQLHAASGLLLQVLNDGIASEWPLTRRNDGQYSDCNDNGHNCPHQTAIRARGRSLPFYFCWRINVMKLALHGLPVVSRKLNWLKRANAHDIGMGNRCAVFTPIRLATEFSDSDKSKATQRNTRLNWRPMADS
jgi:hypothetical protein